MMNNFWGNVTFLNYYKWLRRKQGYQPNTAWSSACMVFNRRDLLSVARDNKHTIK